MKQGLPQSPVRPHNVGMAELVRFVRREEAEAIRKLLKESNSLREAWDLIDRHIKGL